MVRIYQHLQDLKVLYQKFHSMVLLRKILISGKKNIKNGLKKMNIFLNYKLQKKY